MKTGRPLKFKSVKELQEKIDAYFESCWKPKLDKYGKPVIDQSAEKEKKKSKKKVYVMIQYRPYTITGLAVALDTTRDTLLDYEKMNHLIGVDIDALTEEEKAAYSEKELAEFEKNKKTHKEFSDTIKIAKEKCHNYAEESLFALRNPSGAIFNLKNNYDWKDKVENVTTNINAPATLTKQQQKDLDEALRDFGLPKGKSK